MFFVASKIFWLLVQPLSLILLLVLIAFALVWGGRRKLALSALGVAAVFALLVGYTSFGYLLIQPLEDRFAVSATPPEKVDNILLLGGATFARPSTAREITELNQSGDRLVTTLWLAQRYPEAKLVLSGGGGFMMGETESEAETMRRFFTSFGIPSERLILEGESRNTDENAALTRDLVSGDGATILVTSAFHMPRSVGIFEKQGVVVIPWPTDFRSSGDQRFSIELSNPNQNLEIATVAIREWIGLVAYNLTGRTSTLFPAPK